MCVQFTPAEHNCIHKKYKDWTHFCVLRDGDELMRLPRKGDSYLVTLGDDEVLKLLLL